MITNNLSFKGYKNVFCAFDVPVTQNKNVTYMSMQLNDDEYADLSEYRKLKQMQGDVVDQKFNDVVTLTYVKDKQKGSEHLFLDFKEMYWGDELIQLREKFVPKSMSLERYKQEEALHMKAYTLLASLTKRMQFNSFDYEDRDRIKVIERMHNTLYAIVKDKDEAFRLTEKACMKKIKFQDLAAVFNNSITKTMAKFFLR